MIGIVGTIHQGNSRFGGLAGRQCTAIAFTALILAYLSHIPAPSWNSSIIGTIVNDGNQIYGDILLTSPTNHNPHYLMHNELPEQISVGSNQIRSYFYRDIFFGTISQTVNLDNESAVVTFGYTPFSEALQNAFAISDFNLLTISDLTTGVFYSYGSYYMFDSHSRDQYGYVSSNGAAVLLCFS